MKELESQNEQTIVAYLLGELTEDEAQQFERRFLADEQLFHELETIEDELIDDYVSGALSPQRREAFERSFSRSRERVSKVEFARAITEHAIAWKQTRETEVVDADVHTNESTSSKTVSFPKSGWSRPVPRWREWAAIAAALVFAVAAVGLWLRMSKLQNQLAALRNSETALRQSEAETRKNTTELQTQLSEEQKQSQALEEKIDEIQKVGSLDAPSRVIYAVQLGIDYLIGGSKGSGPSKIKSVTIPSKTSLVRIAVEFQKSDFQNFKTTLRRSDRTVVWSRGGLKARVANENQSVSLAIPADRMPDGDYDLVVSGINANGDTESVAHYALKITRRD